MDSALRRLLRKSAVNGPDKLVHLPELIERPKGQRILVLAPHMDDEIIGCGGTLYKHAKAKEEITVVYLTDGRNGNPEWDKMRLSGETRKQYEEELVRIRKEEARRSAEIIGIKELLFLDYPDSELQLSKEAVSRLRDIFIKNRPQVVYLPFLTDNHRDHWQTNRIFCAVIKNDPFTFTCCGYEVWNPINPNYLVDITSCIEIKKKALAEFKSQLRHFDYIHTAAGLNAYRSMAKIHGGFAEAFFICSAKEHLYLYEKILRQ